jgi:sugar phosphate isomerase/epimerase
MSHLTLGAVTDEIDADLERACQVAVELGMTFVELNTVWGQPVDRLPPDDAGRVREIVRRHGLQIDAVGTLAFKALELSQHPALRNSDEFAEQLAAIRRAAHLAQVWSDCLPNPAVRIFAFRREPMQGLGNPSPIYPDGGGIPAAVVERVAEGLNLACDLARAEGVRLLVENVRSCWGNTGVNTARLVAAADRPELGIIWDVANDWVSCGQSYRAGYVATRPYTVAVHLKDARLVDPATGLTAWLPIGQGEADLPGQVADLLRDDFGGPVILETHWRGDGLTKEESSRRSFAGLQAAIAAAALHARA